MTYLSDSTLTVSLYPMTRMEQHAQLIIDRRRNIGGSAFDYLWGSYKHFQIDVEYLTTSDAAQINEWWETTTELTLFFDSTSYQGYITSRDQPFQSLNRPYPDAWFGTISMGIL